MSRFIIYKFYKVAIPEVIALNPLSQMKKNLNFFKNNLNMKF